MKPPPKKFPLLAMIALVAACQTTNPEEANSAAQSYIKHFPDATGVECAQTDTDHDGYCSCTVFRGAAEPEQIQCGCERLCIWNCARGCKYQLGMKFSTPRPRS